MRWLCAAVAVAVIAVLGLRFARRGESIRRQATKAHTGELVAEARDRGATDRIAPAPAQLTALDETASTGTPSTAGERELIGAGQLAGRVLDESGAPISEAELIWTALTDEFCDLKVRLVHEGFERVWEASPAASSSTDGAFVFKDAPRGASDHSSVVWVTHPGYEAARALLEPRASGWTWPPDFRVKRAPCTPVRVIDTSGVPVSGAEVHQFLAFLAYDGDAAKDLEKKARKVFGRRSFTASDGGTCGYAVAGMSVWMARKGDLRAASIWGEHLEKVELVLSPTCRVSGHISTDISGVDPTSATISLAASAARGQEGMTWLLPRIAVRADGTFGPVECPLLEREKLIVRLDDGPFLPSWSERAMPRPGDSVHVAVEAAVGVPLEVTVRDDADKAVPGASVEVGLESSPFDTVLTRVAETGPDGLAHLVCARDRRFEVRAWKQGFALVRTGLLAWAPTANRVEIRLGKGGVIRGRCVHAGAAVKKFDVIYWTKDVYTSDVRTFHDDEGRFKLDDLPRGEMTLFAVSEDLPQSARHTVPVSAEPSEEVVIELPEAATVTGRVVSGIDGSPVSNARVQSFSSHGGQCLTSRGDPKPVRADGGFELTNVGTDGAGYGVEADGYASTYGVVMPAARERLLLETVVLHPLATLRVRLTGESSGDYSGYVFWSEFGERRPPSTFDARGELVLQGLRPATYAFSLRLPEGDVVVEDFQIRPGACEPILFDVSRGRTLVVDVEPHADRSRAVGGTLAIVQRSRYGGELKRTVHITGSVPFRIERLQRGLATLELRDVSDKLLCTSGVEVDAQGEQSIALAIGGRERRLRIVDAQRSALAGAKVELSAAEGESPWRMRAEADGRGELVAGPTNATKLRVSLQHPYAGRACGILVDLGVARDPIEVVLDAQRTFEVRTLEGKTPREGVQFFVDHPAISIYQRCFWTTSANGSIECRGFADGDYELVVNTAGYWPTRHPIHVTADVKPVVIQLTPLGSLRFSAKNEYGNPIANVAIELRSRDLDASIDATVDPIVDPIVDHWIASYLVPAPVRPTTDAQGEWTVSGLPQGSYSWRARIPNADDVTGTCAVAARSTSDVAILVR